MRAPGAGAADRADRYRAAIDMSGWADTRGGVAVVLSEHHASDDGYLPAPLTLASAIAARTEHLVINVAAVVATLHHPIELAEQMVVLDHISRGRVMYVLGLGYRSAEFELYDVALADRVQRLELVVERLRLAFDGAVTPHPFTTGGPALAGGGGTATAARRAARLGLGFMAERHDPSLETAYLDACVTFGRQPRSYFGPAAGAPTAVVVVDDVDRGWRDYGPHLLHDAKTYGQWLAESSHHTVAHGSAARTIDELRDAPGNYRVVDVAGARELVDEFGIVSLMPMCGGAPVDLAWHCVRLMTEEVLAAR
jgi:alkanesulfonate monooxygenase SsuD/methylene tetrahydromethanopterin reductase-like flavin-dependent oxidoreductase (luciferase family)